MILFQEYKIFQLPCACKEKNRGLSVTKAIKIGGIWVPFSQIPADLGSLSEKFPKFWTVCVEKIEDFGRQLFLVKTGVLG